MGKKILFETALTDIKDSDIEGIGSLREDDLGNVYRWVQNTCATAMAAGSCASYPATDGSASPALFKKRISATAAAELSADNFAGICMAAIAASGASTSKYGWVQVKGVYSAASVLTLSSTISLSIGDKLIPASATLDIDRWVTSHDSVSGAITPTAKVNVAIAMQVNDSASARTASTIAIDIHCL